MLWPAATKNDPAPSTWEPVELTALKRKLASLSCHLCNCITARRGIANANPKAVSFEDNLNDKNIQVGNTLRSFDRYTQSCESDILKDHSLEFQHKNNTSMCPSCYVTMNLLRAGKLFKILKDEESEIAADTCDKSTEKNTEYVEKTTSFTTSPYDHYDVCRIVTYSDTSLSEDMKCLPHVKFWDVSLSNDIKALVSPPCVCRDELIESIRPTPL